MIRCFSPSYQERHKHIRIRQQEIPEGLAWVLYVFGAAPSRGVAREYVGPNPEGSAEFTVRVTGKVERRGAQPARTVLTTRAIDYEIWAAPFQQSMQGKLPSSRFPIVMGKE